MLKQNTDKLKWKAKVQNLSHFLLMYTNDLPNTQRYTFNFHASSKDTMVSSSEGRPTKRKFKISSKCSLSKNESCVLLFTVL